MITRKGSAVWEGNLKEGSGRIHGGSGFLDAPYGFGSRFGNTRESNPEELLGAALAACFSMAMSAALGRREQPIRMIQTTAQVHMDRVDGAYRILSIDLHTKVRGPAMEQEDFVALAGEVKESCPVSLALKSTEIRLQAELD